MRQLRPNCECCDRDLPIGDADARICPVECTVCAECFERPLGGRRPNCGGGLVLRPTRPDAALVRFPASIERVLKSYENCSGRAGAHV